MPNKHQKLTRFAPLWIGLVSLVFYLPGLARQPLPGDSSIFLKNAVQLNLNSYAQTHPLFLVVGHWFVRLPFLTPPVAMSLLAAVCAAITVGLCYSIIRKLGGDAWGATIGAASLAVAHTMWYHAEFPECYSMNVMFMAAMLYLVLCWHILRERAVSSEKRNSRAALYLGSGIFLGALGCANHLLVGLSLAVIAIWVTYVVVRERRPMSDLVWACLGGVLGLTFLGVLFWQDAQRLGFETAFHMLLAGGGGIRGRHLISYGGHMFQITPERLVKQILATCGSLVFNFIGPQLLMLPGGALQIIRTRRVGSLIISLFLIHLIFPIGYTIHEFWAFLLPAWFIAAIPVGLGYERFWIFIKTRVTNVQAVRASILAVVILIPALCYWIVPHALTAIDRQDPEELARQGKVIDTLAHYKGYMWPPKSGADASAVWLRTALQKVPSNTTVMLRPAHHALGHYLQVVEHVRPSVDVRGMSKQYMAEVLNSGQAVYTDNLGAVEEVKRLGLHLQVERFDGLWRVEVE